MAKEVEKIIFLIGTIGIALGVGQGLHDLEWPVYIVVPLSFITGYTIGMLVRNMSVEC